MQLLLIPYLVAHLAVGAPVEIEAHYMPPGEKVYLPSAKRWGKGFDLEGYKVLLQMDGDLHEARRQLKLVSDLELQWDRLLEEKDQVIETYYGDLTVYKERTERLENRWTKCEEDLIQAAGGPVWPYILAAAGAVVGIAGIGYGIGAVTSK